MPCIPSLSVGLGQSISHASSRARSSATHSAVACDRSGFPPFWQAFRRTGSPRFTRYGAGRPGSCLEARGRSCFFFRLQPSSSEYTCVGHAFSTRILISRVLGPIPRVHGEAREIQGSRSLDSSWSMVSFAGVFGQSHQRFVVGKKNVRRRTPILVPALRHCSMFHAPPYIPPRPRRPTPPPFPPAAVDVGQTDPAGTYSAWKANAIGGSNSNNMKEFLEKNWANDMDEAAAKKLCMKVTGEVDTWSMFLGLFFTKQ